MSATVPAAPRYASTPSEPIWPLTVEQYHEVVRAGEARLEVYSVPTGSTQDAGYGTRRDFTAGEAVPVVIEGA